MLWLVLQEILKQPYKNSILDQKNILILYHYRLIGPFSPDTQNTASKHKAIQNNRTGIILTSSTDSRRGMQPMDQSKHSHQGFTKSQELIA